MVFFNFKLSSISVPLKIESHSISVDDVLSAVIETGRLSGVPDFSIGSHASNGFHISKEIVLEIIAVENGISLDWKCSTSNHSYVLPLNELHWDFWKVVISFYTATVYLIGGSVFHAACISTNQKTILFPGYSGAGKSSLVFQAFNLGLKTFASELVTVHGLKVVDANTIATIDTTAYARNVIDRTGELFKILGGKYILSNSVPIEEKLSAVIFPKITQGGLFVRNISSRRCRMLLLSNSLEYWHESVLLNHVTTPIYIEGIQPYRSKSIEQIHCLSNLPSFIIEGTAEEILTWINSFL